MYCQKCKYTSFDYLEACPACGYVWEHERSDLNLDWLKPPETATETAVPAPDLEQGSPPKGQAEQATSPAEVTFAEDFDISPAEPEQTGEHKDLQAPDAAARTSPSPREEPASGPQEPREEPELELQGIEYTLEDLPGPVHKDEAEQKDTPETAAGEITGPLDEDVQSRDQDFSEEAEIEIELQDEDTEPAPAATAPEQAGSAPQSRDEPSQDEDVDWSSLIEEIELETDSEPSPDKKHND
ncbi:MAG: hypothetical protein K9J81_12545 [Desulfohalobiaceae bacterium]|nr:hypothetical protein [Desulfohalobiaceae bacterium]